MLPREWIKRREKGVDSGSEDAESGGHKNDTSLCKERGVDRYGDVDGQLDDRVESDLRRGERMEEEREQSEGEKKIKIKT